MDQVQVFWLAVGAIGVAGVIGNSYVAAKKTALIENFVDKGLPIPPQLLESRKKYDWRGFMVAGVILVAIALALILLGCVMVMTIGKQNPDPGIILVPVSGAFPLLIGLACLLICHRLKKDD